MIATHNQALNGFVLMRLDTIDDQAWGRIGGVEALVEIITRIKLTFRVDQVLLDL
jgi:hypothetical protein